MSQMPPLKTVSASVATADPRAFQAAEVAFLPGVSNPPAGPQEGDILIEVSDSRPASLLLRGASFLSGWAIVANSHSTLEKEMRDAGWTIFFMAAEIKATALGFDQSKALRRAVTQLARRAKGQQCNALEITRITRFGFRGISRVSISAHVRHLQNGSAFFGK
jgi:hypothetical protein